MNIPFPIAGGGRSAVRAGRKNVVRVLDAWYVACRSGDLPRDKPIARTLLGIPVALFRDDTGAPAAVLDRCPHRNVPLSMGKVKDGQLQCAYHGWRFDGGGKLRAIPGLPILDNAAPENSELAKPGRNVSAFPTREQDGYVWVWMDAAKTPDRGPFDLEQARWDGYLHVHQEIEIEGTLHSTLENILDVPHTSFLHGGLFRAEEKHHEITAIVRRGKDRVEAQFVGEPRPPGIAARILSPSGGEVEHWDRFFLPSIAQVEYKLGKENHIVTTSVCTPLTETRTVMHSVLSVRTRMPVRFLAFFAMPFAYRIVKQDKVVLRAQTEIVDRFGTETFTSTPIDLLGPYILHLLKKAEAGDLDAAIVREETTKIMV